MAFFRGLLRTQGLCIHSAQLRPPEKVEDMLPVLIFAPDMGTPRSQGFLSHYAQLLGPEKAGFAAAGIDFISFLGDPRACRGYSTIPPSSRPSRR